MFPEPGEHTRCLSWNSGEDVAELRCRSAADTEIMLCGHGLLCCGSAWMRRGQAVSQLSMNGVQAAFHADAELAWVGLPTISCQARPVPHWIGEFFSQRPWRAAEAGGENGYLILEWPQGFDLRSLAIPRYALRRRTGRSLIVTCKSSGDSAIDIELRYFAPQHGVPEDTATGSAMRVLATYWMNRDLNERLRAYQCSHYGGELHSRVHGELTWVGGRVEAGAEDKH